MFFRNWFYLYLHPTQSERAAESLICRLGTPYRAQYPFPRLHRIVDFALTERKVVIEVDGASHDSTTQRHKDLVSSLALEKAGWAVVRFTNAEVLAYAANLPVEFSEILVGRITHRPSIPQLEEALRLLPDPPVGHRRAKPRGRKRAPGPKKAPSRKRAKVDNSSPGNTE